jgi:sialidase-1
MHYLMKSVIFVTVLNIVIVLSGCTGTGLRDSDGILTVDVCPWSAGHPRNDGQIIFPLKDGRLMLVWSEYYATKPSAVLCERYKGKRTHDHFPCRVSAKISVDGGQSWSDSFTLQDNTGKQNVKHPNLLRLDSGEILFFYTMRNASNNTFADVRVLMKRSMDECESWSEPVQVSLVSGMSLINPGQVFQHSSGRIILPSFSSKIYGKGDHYKAFCYYSDDDGHTWDLSTEKIDLPMRGAEEPSMVELKDGTIMSTLRTGLGTVYKAYSYDIGETWSAPESTGLAGPQATHLVKQLSDTGDILLIWNHNYEPDHHHTGQRNPLTAAVSKDGGKTWQHIKNIEDIPDGVAFAPSALVLKDKVLVAYAMQKKALDWTMGTGIRLKIIPIDWFYED